MQVIKRDGTCEAVSFDKITRRIGKLCYGLNIDPLSVAKDTINGMYTNILTQELDSMSADICASKIHHHPDYNVLATRISVSNLHKQTSASFLEVSRILHCSGILSDNYMNFVEKNIEFLNSMINYERDYLFDYFGFKTLERSYLFKVNGKIVERPQHLWMRVAIQIHGLHENIELDRLKETYELMSQLYFTHATPTLFNSGTKRPQLASCFLVGTDDTIENIFKTVSDLASISKWAGGIGLHLSNIRCKGSAIRGTNGKSDGIVPLCKVLDSVGRYINQGSKRNGSIAVYLEPWHGDIYEFIELRKNTGDENLRSRDLFLALWVPDLFMKRVRDGEMWSLMCPDQCKKLNDTYGEEFEKLYLEYEKQGKYIKQVSAMELWHNILECQIETGMPYIGFKDHVNIKSNQKNIGVIKSSNLCIEIVQYSDSKEYGTCNLSSICLPKLVDDEGVFNYDKLMDVVKLAVINLNKVIDVTYYPVPETKYSNMRHRPIGLGVQGLADVYSKMGISFDSDQARTVNKQIFETIYYAALKTSNELAKKYGPYETFKDSPFSKGILQFDMWGLKNSDLLMNFDWDSLKEDIKLHGTRNSLLTALMPTASTSQIMRNNEAFEPYSSNIYVRKTLAGEYIIVNEYLVKSLIKLGLWDKNMYEEILYYNGSIQNIERIPENIRNMYKTAFEMKQIAIVKQAVERGPFIDQTQSMNLFQSVPDFEKLSASHFYAWKNGLKTGMYYLRTQPAADPIKFGLDALKIKELKNKDKNKTQGNACKFRPGQKPEDCLVCSS